MRERMGSGGPRGLQILRSGASRVRGGFDSHAFPPFFFALALTALLAATRPAAAQTVALPDTTHAAEPDTLSPGFRTVGGAAPDTAVVGLRPQHWSAQPRFVMLRSLLVPGWGQFYN